MKMPKDEKAIIAGFRTMEDAENARQRLEEFGVIDQRIDRISERGVAEYEKRRENAITGNYPGLANGVYDQEFGRDQSILLSADASASGMSDGGQEQSGNDVVLSVVVSNEKFEDAKKIVRQFGGEF